MKEDVLVLEIINVCMCVKESESEREREGEGKREKDYQNHILVSGRASSSAV